LVGAAKPVKEPERTRLEYGDHFADILVDTRGDTAIYHWIVQRTGSAEVIHWSQDSSFERAKSAALDYLLGMGPQQDKRG
jgi:hypothetical protein